jgi:hypothetical protein
MSKKTQYIVEGRRDSDNYITIGDPHDTIESAKDELRTQIRKHATYWTEIRVVRRVYTDCLVVSSFDPRRSQDHVW